MKYPVAIVAFLMVAASLLLTVSGVHATGYQHDPNASLSGPSGILVSNGISGMNAEVVQYYDSTSGYLYEAWIANYSIGFARSSDGGNTFGSIQLVPGSRAAFPAYSWDPALAVSPNGTVVVSFMHEYSNRSISPVVDFSFNHGSTFPVSSIVVPESNTTFSDRDYVAVAPNGTVYVTWNFAPYASMVGIVCPPGDSCYYSSGDFNGMISHSSDLGKSWSTPAPFSPGYPYGGMVAAPITVSSNGTIMILYEDYNVTASHNLLDGYNYFIESTNGGVNWSNRVMVGSGHGYLPSTNWWIDGDISLSSSGTIYATYDTYRGGVDVPFLSYSTDNGATWSTVQVAPSNSNAFHITQPASGPNGTVLVAWVTEAGSLGLSPYARIFSTQSGQFITPVEKMSSGYGNSHVWGGDTIGVSFLNGNTVGVSWGQDSVGSPNSEIYFSSMTFYNVSFNEKGLPSNTTWNVSLSGSDFTSQSGSLSIMLPSGNYSAYPASSNKSYAATSSPIDFSVTGSSQEIPVNFKQASTPVSPGPPDYTLYAAIAAVVAAAALLAYILLYRRKAGK